MKSISITIQIETGPNFHDTNKTAQKHIYPDRYPWDLKLLRFSDIVKTIINVFSHIPITESILLSMKCKTSYTYTSYPYPQQPFLFVHQGFSTLYPCSCASTDWSGLLLNLISKQGHSILEKSGIWKMKNPSGINMHSANWFVLWQQHLIPGHFIYTWY